MLKKFLVAAIIVAVAVAIVAAGDMQKSATGNSEMEAMKAGMMKCYVCKNIAAHWDEIGPMGMEAVKLNDGVAIRHWVKSTDPARVAAFHSACEAAGKAGEACMNFSDEQAKTDLCEFCQTVRSAAKAGAHMSHGETADGDIMVMTSSDANVQAQLVGLQQKCAMMAASMEKPAGKQTAQKE